MHVSEDAVTPERPEIPTDPGAPHAPGKPEQGGHEGKIGVGGGDETVVRIQLAARWAETFAPAQGDSLAAALRRFRHAFEYLDAVTTGVEPAGTDGGPAPH